MSRLACAILLLVFAGCGSDDGSPRAVIQTGDGDVTVHVEIADSASERARGLMGRTELEDDAGMVFVFPQDSTSAFWMKDTLIPLSIAFYEDGGRIVRILDMEPCRQDPCPVYEPGAAYRGALEVTKGAFRRWGVEVGDTLRVIGNG
jgi:uncharacterized membrane protein (UPF0127 family)